MGAHRDPTADKAIGNVMRSGGSAPRLQAVPAAPSAGIRYLTREFREFFAGLSPDEARSVGVRAFQMAGSMGAITLEHLVQAHTETSGDGPGAA